MKAARTEGNRSLCNQKFDLEDRFINSAVMLCRIAEKLPTSKIGSHVANQLIRCGTAPAANYGEARGAESRKDFIHKLKICLKELRESMVWLKFIDKMTLIETNKLQVAIDEINELVSIIVKSITTARKNLSQQQ